MKCASWVFPIQNEMRCTDVVSVCKPACQRGTKTPTQHLLVKPEALKTATVCVSVGGSDRLTGADPSPSGDAIKVIAGNARIYYAISTVLLNI
jgi:hypothetical protein